MADISLSAADANSAKGMGQTICRTSDGTYHAVFCKTSGGIMHVFYNTSADGITWGVAVPISLAAPAPPCDMPCIAVDGADTLHVAFRAGTVNYVYKPWGGAWTTFTEQPVGSPFPGPQLVTSTVGSLFIAVGNNNDIMITYSANPASTEVYFVISRNHGVSWTAHAKIPGSDTVWPGASVLYPSLASDSTGHILVVYQVGLPADPVTPMVYYDIYTLATHTWGGVPLNLSNPIFESWYPIITVDNTGKLLVVWRGLLVGLIHQCVIFTKNTGFWNPPIALNAGTAFDQTVSSISYSSDGHYHAFYREDDGTGSIQIYHIEWDGALWGAPDVLTVTATNKTSPTPFSSAFPVTNVLPSGYEVMYLVSAPVDVRVHTGGAGPASATLGGGRDRRTRRSSRIIR